MHSPHIKCREPTEPEVEDSLEASWKALRVRPLRRRRVVEKVQPPPPVEPVIKWSVQFHADKKRPSMLVIPGATTYDRLTFYRKFLSDEWASFRPNTVEDIIGDAARDWVEQGIITNFTNRLASTRLPKSTQHALPGGFNPLTQNWEILWALGSIDGLVAEGSLREMIDQPHYLFHEVYLVLWELRFRIKENRDMKPALPFFNVAIQWLLGGSLDLAETIMLEAVGITRRITTDRERFDVLFFLLTLAEQNALLDRYILCFDGLERVLTPDGRGILRELRTFILTIDHWVRLARSPFGVLLGMDTSPRQMNQLRHLDEKLADEVATGLLWTHAPR
jgi:hypothetical protein